MDEKMMMSINLWAVVTAYKNPELHESQEPEVCGVYVHFSRESAIAFANSYIDSNGPGACDEVSVYGPYHPMEDMLSAPFEVISEE